MADIAHKRFWLAVVGICILTGLTIAGIVIEKEALYVTACGGIISIVLAFIGADSYRPSGVYRPKKHFEGEEELPPRKG